MLQLRDQTVHEFGLDQTGQITYTFNQQGFRSSFAYDFVPDHAFFGASLVFGIGVAQDQTFASMFEHSHNYGLAGTHYGNSDIFQILIKYLASPWYHPRTKICVVWTDRDQHLLDQYYHQLPAERLISFFCGQALSRPNCHAFPSFVTVDRDCSGTHIGPRSHKNFYRILCNQFNQ